MRAAQELVHRETQRRWTIRYKVEAVIESTRVISDEAVREWADLDADAEVDADLIAEYVAETDEDDGAWDLYEVTHWDRIEKITNTGETTRMVAPPEFVPLPGMEGI